LIELDIVLYVLFLPQGEEVLIFVMICNGDISTL